MRFRGDSIEVGCGQGAFYNTEVVANGAGYMFIRGDKGLSNNEREFGISSGEVDMPGCEGWLKGDIEGTAFERENRS